VIPVYVKQCTADDLVQLLKREPVVARQHHERERFKKQEHGE